MIKEGIAIVDDGLDDKDLDVLIKEKINKWKKRKDVIFSVVMQKKKEYEEQKTENKTQFDIFQSMLEANKKNDERRKLTVWGSKNSRELSKKKVKEIYDKLCEGKI